MQHKISIECERRIAKLEQSMWGDDHKDCGATGNINVLEKRMEKFEFAYAFCLGGLSLFNFFLGVYAVFKIN